MEGLAMNPRYTFGPVQLALWFDDEAHAIEAAQEAFPDCDALVGATTLPPVGPVPWVLTPARVAARGITVTDDLLPLIKTYDAGIDVIGTETWPEGTVGTQGGKTFTPTGATTTTTDPETGEDIVALVMAPLPLFRVNVIIYDAAPQTMGLLRNELRNVLIPQATQEAMWPYMRKFGVTGKAGFSLD